jgi:hypothetical protein
MNEFINPKLADNFLRGGFAILGVDLDFFLARGKGMKLLRKNFVLPVSRPDVMVF